MRSINKRGISLLEVVMSLGLLSIVSLGVLQLFSNMNGFIKSAENKSFEMQLISEISQVAADKDLCKKAITDIGVQKVDLSSNFKLKLKLPGTGEISEGMKVKGSLIIKDFYIDSFSSPIASAVVGEKRVTGAIWLHTEDDNFKSVPRKKKNIGVINLVYNDSTKEIVECFGTLDDPKTKCESLGFEWSGSKCRQSAQQSCIDIGGSWNNSKCQITNVDQSLSIINKTCTGTNVALVGFDSTGKPICQLIQVAQGGGGSPAPAPPQPTVSPAAVITPATPVQALTCPSGNKTIKSSDGTNTCVFSWDATALNTAISCNNGIWCSAGGGSMFSRCGSDGKYASTTYSCPDSSPGSCVGGSNTIKSVDGTNTCTFTWSQASNGTDFSKVGSATGGGTLDGKCINGVWSGSFLCPGQKVTCPGGYYTLGTCNFKYDAGPVGSSLKSYDLNGKGTLSGIICGSNGKWDNSKVVLTGCN